MTRWIVEVSDSNNLYYANKGEELIECQNCEKNPYLSDKDTAIVVHTTMEHCWFFASRQEPQYCSLGVKKNDRQID